MSCSKKVLTFWHHLEISSLLLLHHIWKSYESKKLEGYINECLFSRKWLVYIYFKLHSTNPKQVTCEAPCKSNGTELPWLYEVTLLYTDQEIFLTTFLSLMAITIAEKMVFISKWNPGYFLIVHNTKQPLNQVTYWPSFEQRAEVLHFAFVHGCDIEADGALRLALRITGYHHIATSIRGQRVQDFKAVGVLIRIIDHLKKTTMNRSFAGLLLDNTSMTVVSPVYQKWRYQSCTTPYLQIAKFHTLVCVYTYQ